MHLVKIKLINVVAVLALLALCGPPPAPAQSTGTEAVGMKEKVRLLTLDPGHFHASLVQKKMYDQVDPTVHVYAPAGPELDEHLKKIESFNSRPEKPTQWNEVVKTGPDFLERMIAEKKGNMVVISGNNAKKTEYILECVNAGLNVLSDKPMAITPADYQLLVKAFEVARKKKVMLYDIMTERYEITTLMQRELSLLPEVFGKLATGTPEKPAVTKESVHHYCKTVAGSPLKRPAWFFDVKQQGEGIVDVTTHLVDLIQWECFPAQIIKKQEVNVYRARRSTTRVTPEQFKKVTGLEQFPDYLKKDVKDDALEVYCNGEINYTIRGIHAKASVIWNFEAPAGGGDTHYSMMRGSKANLIIKQGKEQNFVPTLYVEKNAKVSDEAFEKSLRSGVAKVSVKYPGLEVKKLESGWMVVIPDSYRDGHEAHFGQVTEKYLGFLASGEMPKWEVPNMLTKYYTIMQAYKMSR